MFFLFISPLFLAFSQAVFSLDHFLKSHLIIFPQSSFFPDKSSANFLFVSSCCLISFSIIDSNHLFLASRSQTFFSRVISFSDCHSGASGFLSSAFGGSSFLSASFLFSGFLLAMELDIHCRLEI